MFATPPPRRNAGDTKKKSLAETLECPVCSELPTAPIFGCQNGHIICNNCKDLVQHCAVCRAEKFNVRNVVIEEILSSPSLQCPFRDEGCRVPNMTGEAYTAHLKICEYRPIECHCRIGEECDRVYNKDEYLDHMIDYHGANHGQHTHLVKCQMRGPFVPTHFSYSDKEFILMSHREGPRFWTWVAVNKLSGPREQLYVKITLRYLSAQNEVMTFSSDIIQPVSLRDNPIQVLKSGHCLEFSAATAPPSLPPYVWPEYVEEGDGEGGFRWTYDVELHQGHFVDLDALRNGDDLGRSRVRSRRTPRSSAPPVYRDPQPRPNNAHPNPWIAAPNPNYQQNAVNHPLPQPVAGPLINNPLIPDNYDDEDRDFELELAIAAALAAARARPTPPENPPGESPGIPEEVELDDGEDDGESDFEDDNLADGEDEEVVEDGIENQNENEEGQNRGTIRAAESEGNGPTPKKATLEEDIETISDSDGSYGDAESDQIDLE